MRVTSQIILVQHIVTDVFVTNDEILVIGEIYEEQTSESVSKVSVSGNSLLLALLFMKKGIIDNRTEPLICPMSRIIKPALTATQ